MTFEKFSSLLSNKVDNTGGSRFSNKDIAASINEGLRQVSLRTNLYIKSANVTLVNDQTEYDRPDEIYNIRYGVYDNKRVRLSTEQELDRIRPNWRDYSISNGKVMYILLSSEVNTKFQVFPQVKRYKDTTLTLVGRGLPTLLDGDSSSLDSEEIHMNDLYIDTLVYYVAQELLSRIGRTEELQKAQYFNQQYLSNLGSLIIDNTVSESNKETLNSPFGLTS